MPDKRTAWLCIRESLHDFRWSEWAPFGWMLAAQAAFLICALNLGTPWGMAGVGLLTRIVRTGDAVLQYPQFFTFLPTLASLVEWFLYVVAGSVLIPLALLRIAAPMEPPTPRDRGARLRRAILPTLVGGFLNIALLQGWNLILGRTLAPVIAAQLPGAGGEVVIWLLGALGSFVLSAPFLYVPIHAVRRGTSFAAAVGGGLREGVQLLWPTFLVIGICSLPGLLPLAPAQINPSVIVQKMRPEIVGWLLLGYSVITAFANYFIYSSAMRLHWARRAA